MSAVARSTVHAPGFAAGSGGDATTQAMTGPLHGAIPAHRTAGAGFLRHSNTIAHCRFEPFVHLS